MGSTHGRLILILVVASANSILFLEGRFLITCQLNNELQKAQPFFKSVFTGSILLCLFLGFELFNFHGSLITTLIYGFFYFNECKNLDILLHSFPFVSCVSKVSGTYENINNKIIHPLHRFLQALKKRGQNGDSYILHPNINNYYKFQNL
jgi:hypothetical protein